MAACLLLPSCHVWRTFSLYQMMPRRCEARAPANRSAICCTWPLWLGTAVSVSKIGSSVKLRTAVIVGTNSLLERDFRAEVVDVQPNPVNIRLTRPPWTQRWIDPRIPRSVAAQSSRPRRPFRAPCRGEYLVDMPPRGNEYARWNVAISPRIPRAIHLMPEREADGGAKRTYRRSILAQVAVIPASGDGPESDPTGVKLDQWQDSLGQQRPGPGGREWLPKRLIALNDSRLKTCSLLEPLRGSWLMTVRATPT